MPDEDTKLLPAQQLSPQQRMALRLYVLGRPDKEIAEATGYSLARVRSLRREDAAKEYVKECEAELEEEFGRLHRKVIDVVEAGLESADANVALASANLWLKASGKFVTRVEKRDLTAEDIVQKIISGELAPRKREPMRLKGVIVSSDVDEEKQEYQH